jgi:3-deoxy-D-manno-octulosonate 8-phosphate phosphatase KdsC-like HAD superfamily phosphatase
MFDARALRRAKYGIAPRGAVNISKLCADYVTEVNGGEGVFLEVLVKVIELNEIDMNIIAERLGIENE